MHAIGKTQFNSLLGKRRPCLHQRDLKFISELSVEPIRWQPPSFASGYVQHTDVDALCPECYQSVANRGVLVIRLGGWIMC